MKYLIAYKQNEQYCYVSNINQTIGTTLAYINAIDFLSLTNAKNVCKFLNESDTTHEYIVLTYEYTIKEEK